jgi:hypothetical protein
VTGTLNRWFYPQDPTLDPIGGIYATSGVANFWGADYAVLQTDPGGPASYAIAMTQSVALPANAFLHFNHAHDFARNAIQRFTGGVVEYSTNGGATWNDTAALYTGNGYNGTISGGTGNPLAGRKAFTSTSYGYLSSRLNLSTLAGQNVRFRFRIAADNGPGLIGWFVDDVRIYTCGGAAGANSAPTVSPGAVNYAGGITVSRGGAAVTREIARVSDDRDLAGSLTVSVSGLPAGMTATATNSNGLMALTINGGCATAEGAYQVTLSASDSGGLVGSATIPVTVEPAGQAVKDQSFEFGSPNPYWAETFFGSAALLCDTGSCVTSATAGPRTGIWWARFGSPLGTSADGFIQQQITVPSGSPKLEFYLRIGSHSGSGTADFVRLKIGATTVFSVTDATTNYDNVYKKVTIDLTPFAGSTRLLRFEAHNQVGAATFRVHVDDVTTTSTQSSCAGVFPTRAFLPVARK